MNRIKKIVGAGLISLTTLANSASSAEIIVTEIKTEGHHHHGGFHSEGNVNRGTPSMFGGGSSGYAARPSGGNMSRGAQTLGGRSSSFSGRSSEYSGRNFGYGGRGSGYARPFGGNMNRGGQVFGGGITGFGSRSFSGLGREGGRYNDNRNEFFQVERLMRNFPMELMNRGNMMYGNPILGRENQFYGSYPAGLPNNSPPIVNEINIINNVNGNNLSRDLVSLQKGEVVEYQTSQGLNHLMVEQVNNGRVYGRILEGDPLEVNSIRLEDLAGNVRRIAKWDR